MRFALLLILICIHFALLAQPLLGTTKQAGYYSIPTTSIYVDTLEAALLHTTAKLLQQDIQKVTGQTPAIVHTLPANKPCIVIATLESSVIKSLQKAGKLNARYLHNRWEAYQVQTIYRNTQPTLVIIGSDKRGTAYGVMALCRQMGVSPWYWWADVPVQQQQWFINSKAIIKDAPAVKYRGIFINDEAPALSNWSKEKFGGFNHLFYEHVFELMLRLKANYLWPTMWGNAFYDDDSLNIKTAEEYGIVIGTSHHEPLMRAHDEWRRYGHGKWNYDNNAAALQAFWHKGLQRATNEKIVTIGMRGDGDEPMSRETATALLERIVADQRNIITTVTGKPAEATPQLWALYKEVQDYYDKGMRVPDDVTLLLCDDNWGNLRRLPALNAPQRKGGYGIYYHFDYVGGPRNYKWINTNNVVRVWEQMHLAWEYNARQIWIVNVGDIKPMELPMSFFLDYAWKPSQWKADNIHTYHTYWAVQQFGKSYADSIGYLLASYTQYNSRRKPELLSPETYSLTHFEWHKVVSEYKELLSIAERIQYKLLNHYHNAFFQLVLHPIKASANLNALYATVAQNRQAYKQRTAATNIYADSARSLFQKDAAITTEYHQLNKSKWNHMMDQTHIGYTNWQQPERNSMPSVHYLPKDSIDEEGPLYDTAVTTSKNDIPANAKYNCFYERDGYVSMEAAHYSRQRTTTDIQWKTLQGMGRDGDGVTAFPVTHAPFTLSKNTPYLEFEVYTYSSGRMNVQAYCSPTLNILHTVTGLRYAISIDDEQPQIISLNKEDNDVRTWSQWVANNCIIKTSTHMVNKPGKHIVRYWLIDPGIILQKLVLSNGQGPYVYLGPQETIKHPQN